MRLHMDHEIYFAFSLIPSLLLSFLSLVPLARGHTQLFRILKCMNMFAFRFVHTFAFPYILK